MHNLIYKRPSLSYIFFNGHTLYSLHSKYNYKKWSKIDFFFLLFQSIKWNIICSNKDKGGLGVRRLWEFNMALLDKWWWRLKEEQSSLWFRVLASRFGEDSLFVHEDGRRGSMWWRNLVTNGLGVGTSTKGSWIDDNCVCEVGDGNSFLFWWDP